MIRRWPGIFLSSSLRKINSLSYSNSILNSSQSSRLRFRNRFTTPAFRHGQQRQKGNFGDRRRAGHGKHGLNVERITENTLSGRRLTAMRNPRTILLIEYIYIYGSRAYGVRSFQRRTFLVRKQTFNSPCKYYVCGSRRFGTLFVTLSIGQRINVSLPPPLILYHPSRFRD